ncbi:copper chaperone PCu(A)C [Brevirhabdus sp.]|uniref:copper chaperone PCu(A)C n=1 Tax=Brevirhabdus sp. TaxID=2004514 RepID=UPI004059BC78
MFRPVMIAALLSTAPALSTPALAEVTVTAPWARASILASRPAAVYLTLSADPGDRLLSLSTPLAEKAMVHTVETGADGIARMSPMQDLPLAAGVAVTMAPGGMHIMLTGLSRKLVEGESFPLTLTFEDAGTMTLQVPVQGIAAKAPPETAH